MLTSFTAHLLQAALLLAPQVTAAGSSAPSVTRPGRPPDTLWQQRVSYSTEARLDEDAQVLHAVEVVRYHNASPDTLKVLFFHLYLNAFRPHSIWARTEQRKPFDFGALRDPDYGYERVRSAELVPWGRGGSGTGADASGSGARDRSLTAAYPFAPDSTVVRFDLPRPLAPGDSTRVRIAWDARPATLCRRQCRRGRHWDFAQWYPRVAVFDTAGWEDHPLHPQGEFYGEFGTYDVTLDLASDQVLGATGVPVEGDPGWKPDASSPDRTVDYQRDWYGRPVRLDDPGLLDGPASTGRKRVRFRAERVHHFAWSVDPAYRYEQGHLGKVAVRVLYRPGDLDWDLGAAVRRTIRALRWLGGIYGPYPWPQLTNLHRLEGGGTEFPMVIMNGGPGQGLITHESSHQYNMGILANNEWKEGWLDEGMASFLTNWFEREHGVAHPWARTMRAARAREAAGATQVVSEPSEDFVDYATYGAMIYTKGSVVLRMLRWLVGEDTFREGMHVYYRDYRFHHVDGADLQAAMEKASGRELAWFFHEWLRTTWTLDYALGDVHTVPDGTSGWKTSVQVTRRGRAWMPVDLAVGDSTLRLDSRDESQTVTVVTTGRPDSVVLDPRGVLLETSIENNRTALPAHDP
ncbi:MAG: M1 family metallopeptidase [Candidatus Palauibacterales bacterium]|nr:M1 family metallopeptidase [Candidatus Palauibacterales bacterium]